MIWSEGFTAIYYVTIVDPKTWRDIGRMEITGGSINRSGDELMESADIEMTSLPASGEAWVRIWLDADQQGITHVPLFTGLTSAPSREIDGQREIFNVECYSVLKPIDDILVERGYYIPAEVSAPNAIRRLLKTGIAPVEVEPVDNPPTLTESIVAEDGETNLTMAEKVLSAIGWRLRIDGRGVIHVEQGTGAPVQTFNATNNDVIEMSVSDEFDWFSCPNVFRATSADLTAIARDDDPASSLSTVTRGREIWAEETSVTLGSNESLSSYAIRRLKELQSPSRTISYSRRFDPDVTVGDTVRINHPAISIDGLFRIKEQSIELTYGCRTSESAEEVV